MVKVIHFGLSSNKGGIESYLKRITENIDKQEVHFSFIDMTGANSKPFFREELEALGCDFFKITPRNVSVLQNRKDLEELFGNHSFDILHFHVNTLSYITPIEVALKHHCKVIVHSRSGSATPKPATKLLHTVNKVKIRRLPIVRVAVSRAAGIWMFGKRSNFQVFNNGINTTRFTFDPTKRTEVRQKLGDEDNYVIGHVGSFLPVKNYELIVDVVSCLLSRGMKTVLWLIGDGPLRETIEKKVEDLGISDYVRFLGLRNDVPDLYSGMDLFIFPSIFEGFPNAVLEAQCEGLPCLISDRITKEVDILDCVFRENIDQPKEKWVEKVLWIEEKKIPESYRTAASEILRDKGFSADTEVCRVENLYKSVMGN